MTDSDSDADFDAVTEAAKLLPVLKTVLVPSSDVQHDPDGPCAQYHNLPDGGGVITFSEEFITELDWQLGDEIIWDFKKAETGTLLQNKTAEARLQLRIHGELHRAIKDDPPKESP